MSGAFEPNRSILPEAQQRLWSELGATPSDFVLCGGTAIALQLGHRASLDFDFFASLEFDPDALYAGIAYLAGSQVVQKAANTLTCLVDRGGPVRVSFFGTPKLRFSNEPLQASDNGIAVASLVDLAGMKAAVIQKRAEAKDYLDLDAILRLGHIDLPTALAAAGTIYGRSFNPELTLKALCFYGDGDLATLPDAVRQRLAAEVRGVKLDQLPNTDRT